MSAPYPINVNIPNAPNDPADDQPEMKTNFANINGYLAVDHVEPGAVGAGFHQRVVLDIKHPQGAQVGQQSAIYSKSGVADPSPPELFYRSSQGEFALNSIRAFGCFNSVSVNGAVSIINAMNVDSVTASTGTTGEGSKYTIVLTSGVVSGNNAIVLVTYGLSGLGSTVTFTNPNLVIDFIAIDPPLNTRINFSILQI